MPTKQKILHFDTVDAVENYDKPFSNRKNGSGQNVTGSHSYNSRLDMTTPINNVKSISLKTVQIPFITQNIRSSNVSNYINFYGTTIAGVYFVGAVTLKDKNYTSITTLLADLNTAFATKISTFTDTSGLSITFYVNPLDTSKIVIKSNVHQDTGGLIFGDLNFDGSILARNILGVSFFRTANPDMFLGNTVDAFSYMYCTNNYNLQPDNYFNLNFTNIETSPTNANGRPTTFKIPLSGSFGEVIYYSETDGSEQKVYVDRPNTTLSYLNMVITDRWGFPVYGFGSQISFTLNVEYEEQG
jgi:hypothetical protein